MHTSFATIISNVNYTEHVCKRTATSEDGKNLTVPKLNYALIIHNKSSLISLENVDVKYAVAIKLLTSLFT